MDEGRAHCAILERRDGVIVGCTGELGTTLGEASYALAKALPRLLLAVAQLPRLAGVHVGVLEVADEDPT
jgi:hypothetical protein